MQLDGIRRIIGGWHYSQYNASKENTMGLEWFKTSYLIAELLLVWGVLSLLTKLPQDKIFSIVGLFMPFTIVILSLFDDFQSGIFHIAWYLLWAVVGVLIYLTIPMTYRHYLRVGREFQMKNNERSKEDDTKSKD